MVRSICGGYEEYHNAPNKGVAAAELDNLEKKLGGKYLCTILSWRNNRNDLTVFFQFLLGIRKKVIQPISLKD